MSKSVKSNLMRGSFLLGLGLMAGHAASAQAPAPAAPAAPAAAAADDNVVIITAQKRPENLQDVPIVVSAFGAQKLQDAGVHDIKQLATITPGVTVTSTGSNGSTTARIRGIGTVSDNPGLEAQVAIQIDGVARARNGVAFNDLGELSDIEVIKGPQGTLFGKNTTAGVIAVNTKRPSFNYQTNLEATAGNFSSYGGAASITGPIFGDKVAGRLFVADRQRDGYYKVNTIGDAVDLNDQNMFTTRAQILVQPTSNFDINFIGDYTARKEHCCGASPTLIGATAAAVNALITGTANDLPAVANPNNFVAFYNAKNTEEIREGGLSAEAHYKFDNNITLTSITSGRSWKDSAPDGADPDYTNADIIRFANGGYTRFKDYSQEFRLAGNTDNLQWLAGVYLAKQDIDVASSLLFGTQYGLYVNSLTAFTSAAANFPGLKGRHDTYKQDENTQAIFTQETYKVNDQIDVTAGLRYTWDSKKLASHYTNDAGADAGCLDGRSVAVPGPFFGSSTVAVLDCYIASNFFNNFSQNQSEKEKALTGTVKASYKPFEDFMTYASYSRGFLAGGFNFDRVLDGAFAPTSANSFTPNPVSKGGTKFSPTYVNAYEVGEKWRLLDGKMTLNAAVFYQKYRDFQLNTFNGVNFFVTSIPEVVSQGVEVDTQYAINSDLKANLGVTYADTFYPNTTRNSTSLIASALPRLPGANLPLAPLFSTTTGLSYQHSLGSGLKFRASGDVKYQSKTNTGSDLDPVKAQSGYAIMNARVGIGSDSSRWVFEVWGNNIFDKYYNQVAFSGPFQTGTYYAFGGLPRMFGATVRAKF